MASNYAISLPTEISGITTDWLDAALRSWTPGVKLRHSEIVDINHGTCTKIRIALDMNEAGRAAGIPASVILKGGFEPHSRIMHYMHGEEVHSYADVGPATPLRMPGCYFAAYDREAQQGIVVMDDLVARGVEFCHPQKPQTPGAVARRLTMLARHHAMTWDSPEIQPGGRLAGPTTSPTPAISRPCWCRISGRAMLTAHAALRLRCVSMISTG